MKKTRNVLTILCTAAAMMIMTGCSKNNDNNSNGGKNAKLSFTVDANFQKSEGDHFDVSVSAADGSGTMIDWQVNGETQKGTLITAGTDDFNGGKTILFQSARNFNSGSVTFGGFEFGDTPFTLSYKLEVGGKVIDEGTHRFVKNASPVFTKRFDF